MKELTLVVLLSFAIVSTGIMTYESVQIVQLQQDVESLSTQAVKNQDHFDNYRKSIHVLAKELEEVKVQLKTKQDKVKPKEKHYVCREVR